MATRVRSRIVVKSKSKNSMVSTTSSSPSESSSEGPYTIPVTSTPIHKGAGMTPSPPTIVGPTEYNVTRPHAGRLKSSRNKIKPLPRPHSVSAGAMPYRTSNKQPSRGSSSSDGDDVFSIQGGMLAQTTPLYHIRAHGTRPMYLSAGQLLPNRFYAPGSTSSSYRLGHQNQAVPVLQFPGNRVPPISSPNYQSHLSSPSPTLDMNSTFSSLSSPLPPLLIHSMRKGGTAPSVGSHWQADSILENVLPGGILKVFIGTWNMNEQKVCNTIIL